MAAGLSARTVEMTILQKLGQVNWGLILLIATTASIGFAFACAVAAIALITRSAP